MRVLALGVLVAAVGCGRPTEAAPSTRAHPRPLAPATELCVTHGVAQIGREVTDPTLRAIARGTSGDAAALEFIYRGAPETVRELASGQARRQVGLKLRAQDGCNVVYVMWRLDKPKLDVSIKRNLGARDHEACGANGYRKIKPTRSWPTPTLAIGAAHALRAAITGDELTVWIDDHVSWRGKLPVSARTLVGPSGLRSDNLAFELVGFSAPPADAGVAVPACPKSE